MQAKVHIGIAGWSYPDWKGIVYPRRVDPLTYVSRFVDAIEINSTFYRPPEARLSETWLKKTEARQGFFFTAKLHQDFTHHGHLDPGMVESFHEGLAPLVQSGRLDRLLAQFRYDFQDQPAHREQLKRLVESFNETFDLVVEVRHVSWQQPEALEFVASLGVTVCNLDYPVGPQSFNPDLCTIGSQGYFRLHGRNHEKWFSRCSRDETYNYFYNEEELAQIHQRIDRLSQALKTLTVITNNHYQGAELANALELKALLTGQRVEVPEPLLEAYPHLNRISVNRTLFDEETLP